MKTGELIKATKIKESAITQEDLSAKTEHQR